LTKNIKAIKQKRYGAIDLAKHLLALFVIFQHMTSLSRYSQETNLFIANIVTYINGAVIGFFMISGFFFNISGSLKSSIIKIFKRTMIPFFVFSIIYAFLLFLLGKGSLTIGLLNTIKLHGASMQLYYLPYLFGIYTFYQIFLRISPNRHYLITCALIIFSALSLLLQTDSATGSDPNLMPLYSLAFGIGLFMKKLKNQNTKFPYSISLLAALMLLFIGNFDYRFYHLTAILLLLAFTYYISDKYPFFDIHFPGSGGVYLLHTPIINFSLSTLLMMIGISEITNLLFSFIATYILTLIFTLTFTKLFPNYRFLLLE
jgi:hypothetical protein